MAAGRRATPAISERWVDAPVNSPSRAGVREPRSRSEPVSMNDTPSLDGEAGKQARILQSVLDSLDQGVVVADSHGNVLLCNPAVDRIVGVPLSTLPLREWV